MQQGSGVWGAGNDIGGECRTRWGKPGKYTAWRTQNPCKPRCAGV